VGSGKPWIQGSSLIFLELLDKCVFHLGEERGIELIPLGRFQIGLFQYCSLAEDVNGGANVQIPARQLSCVSFVGTVEFFHIVLGVLDNNLVRLSIKTEYDDNIVFLAVFDPP